MAGRIPQHFIDQLINRIDIVDLIDSYVPLKKAGANYKACCPFHNEKSPSFTVSQTKQFYHCFGCGANGTAISWLMEYEHMEFREAIEKLASNVGLDIPEEAQGYEHKPKVSQGIDLYQLMDTVNEFYQTQLRQHPDKQQAIDYLKNRNLSGEIAKRFGLGFAPDGWDNLMSAHGATDASKKALVDTGMLSQNDNERIYDRFRARIMFPIHDHRGRVVGFGGRVLGQGEPKYLNSPETPIFHKGSELYGLYAARGGIKEAGNVLVVEGYMDVVALAQAGIDNAVATLGTATTPMHLQRLLRHSQNIVFSFDGDRAGRAAAWKALETCLPLLDDGCQISFLFLPDGEDPDSMVNKIAKDAFIELIEKATPLTDFLIDSLVQQADLERLDGRAKLVRLAKPLLAKFPKGVLRKLVIERLAGMTQTSPQDFLDTANTTKSSTFSRANKKTASRHTQPLPMSTVRKAISMLIQQPALAQSIPTEFDLSKITIKGGDLLNQLIGSAKLDPAMNTAALLEQHRQESHFSALEKLAGHDHLIPENEISNSFIVLLQQLENDSTGQQLEELLEKSRHETLNNDEKNRLKELLSNNQR